MACMDRDIIIYHTETQADYDALMVELKEQGCKWASGDRMTELTKNWKRYSSETCVRVDKKVVVYDKKSYYKEDYPNIPITKYKAKADEKMRFNKQNIERAFDKFMQGGDTFTDLKERIINLVDEPKKVVVPKFVAEWIEWNKERGVSLQLMLGCYDDFRVGDEEPDVSSEGLKAVHWYVDNPYKFIQAYEGGYTIESERLYYIPLPHLETTDGIQQVLSKRKNDTNYFASRPNDKLKQRYTKEELERVPEIYKPFAKPIEEEEE